MVGLRSSSHLRNTGAEFRVFGGTRHLADRRLFAVVSDSGLRPDSVKMRFEHLRQ